jgi:hypothetical protein
MSRSRNSNTNAIMRAITSAKNEIIAEIQRAHHYGSQSTDFSSIQGPMTMDEMVNSEQDDNSKGPMTLNELVNSIPDDSNESIQYVSKGPMTLNELMDSIQPNNSKGPMTLAELESPSQTDSPEIVLVAGRSRKQLKSRNMKRTGRGKSRKYRRNARK